jgi:hypothetical protein
MLENVVILKIIKGNTFYIARDLVLKLFFFELLNGAPIIKRMPIPTLFWFAASQLKPSLQTRKHYYKSGCKTRIFGFFVISLYYITNKNGYWVLNLSPNHLNLLQYHSFYDLIYVIFISHKWIDNCSKKISHWQSTWILRGYKKISLF